MIQLTPNFTPEEFTVSTDYPQLARLIQLNPLDVHKIFYLCRMFLQPVRDEFGPVTVLSGKRSQELNTAVGGSTTSDHLYIGPSAAADFTCPKADMLDVYQFLKLRGRLYGQMIFYSKSNFIHISLPTPKHLGVEWSWLK